MASEWTDRKGLKDFIKLEKMLDRTKYRIVLVGLMQKQIKELPDTIIGIERTQNIQELVGIYTRANVFFNPTYEDNFPTTNLEAIACGTPIITYNTGGSPEVVTEKTGAVCKVGDLENVKSKIVDCISKKIETVNEQYDYKQMVNCYIKLYRKIMK